VVQIPKFNELLVFTNLKIIRNNRSFSWKFYIFFTSR